MGKTYLERKWSSGKQGERAWPGGKVLGWYAEERRFDPPLRLTFLFQICDLWALSREFTLHNQWNIKMAHIAAHLNAEIILVVAV